MNNFDEISKVESFLKEILKDEKYSEVKKALMDLATLHKERYVEFLLEDAENYQQVCGVRGAIRILDRLQNVVGGRQ